MAKSTIPPNLRDFTQTKLGRFTVLSPIGIWNGGRVMWLCQCSCGARRTVAAEDIDQQVIKHCHCETKVRKRGAKILSRHRHGHRGNKNNKTRTYRSWAAMMTRCANPKDASYKWYGAAGITVCERWQNFGNFLADMGERPPEMTLDRINPYGNYEPGNCRWATPRQQTHNRRKLDEFGNFFRENPS